MNGVSPGLLLLMIPLLPLLGAVTLWGGATLGLPSSGRSLAVLAAASSVLAVVAAIVLLGVSSEPLTLTVGRWMELSHSAAGGINVSLRWDPLTACWLLASGLAALLAIAAGLAPTRAAAAWSLMMLAAVQFVVMAASFWQMFVAAELVSVAAWQFLCSVSSPAEERPERRDVLTWGLLSDLPLIVGLTALWQAFGTLNFAVVLDAPPLFDAAGSEASRVMAGFAAFCLVAAGMARCAQFPVGHWLMASVAGYGPAACVVVCLGVLPTGAFLLMRSLPLLAAHPAALTLLGNWGCLSALVWGAVVLTQSDLPRAAAAFAAGTLGLVCMGLGLGGDSGSSAAVYLACNVVLLTPVLLHCDVPVRSGGESQIAARPATAAGERVFRANVWVMLIVAVALASGIWGQESVLRTLWAPHIATEADAAVMTEEAPTDASAFPLPLPALVAVAAHLLLSLGLFRAVLPAIRSRFMHDHAGRPHLALALLPIGAALSMPLALGLQPRLFGSVHPGDAGRFAELALPGMTALLMLLALLLAWLLNTRPQDVATATDFDDSLSLRDADHTRPTREQGNAWPTREQGSALHWTSIPSLARRASETLLEGRRSATPEGQNGSFAGLVRLSQRQFYIADACRLCFVLPLTVCGGAVRLLERHVWEQPLLREACDVSDESLADAADHAVTHPAWPALCLFLAAATVLILLLAGG